MVEETVEVEGLVVVEGVEMAELVILEELEEWVQTDLVITQPGMDPEEALV